MAFKPPAAAKPGLWRRVPPAVFPPIMGLFGLGLAWRRAAELHGVPAAVGEAVLGAVTLLYLFALTAYSVKLVRRPAVIVDDLRILPGRAGLGAMVLCPYLLALTIAPYWTTAAQPLLFAGFTVHVVFVVILIGVFASGPAEQRRVTPIWHLNFVGFIIGALAAGAFGLYLPALALFAVTAVLATIVWAVSSDQMVKETVPAPLRPLLAIHVSPAALLGLVAATLELQAVAQTFAALGAVLTGWLLIRLRWVVEGGFSALWGAFTFPTAAIASLWLTLGGAWYWPGVIALTLATLIVPPITFQVLRLWARGQLAIKTNAATA